MSFLLLLFVILLILAVVVNDDDDATVDDVGIIDILVLVHIDIAFDSVFTIFIVVVLLLWL